MINSYLVTSFSAIIFALILMVSSSHAEQYQSYGQAAPKQLTKEAKKSIADLENELGSLKDDYTRDSTTRFLARHYAQKKGDGNIEKALTYYQQALAGKGLSDIAKQEMLIEVIDIQYFLKKYSLVQQSIKQYQGLEGRLSIDLQLKLALSLHYLKKPQAALITAETLYEFIRTTLFNHAVDPYIHPKLDMNTEQLTQLLFIFFENKRYGTSIELQTIILERESLVADHWVRLSQIYLVNSQTEKAANTLLLAAQKGLELNQEHILILCDLMAQNNNPYIAARLLTQMINEFQVTAEFTHYEKLFSYWYQAQEIDNAIEVANIMMTLVPDIDRQLDLAQLYYQTQDWKRMNATILNACESGLTGKQSGRANYLLGISELKLNNIKDAKFAFIQASLIGGYVTVANQYLDYLNVNREEYMSITGAVSWLKGRGRCKEDDSIVRESIRTRTVNTYRDDRDSRKIP